MPCKILKRRSLVAQHRSNAVRRRCRGVRREACEGDAAPRQPAGDDGVVMELHHEIHLLAKHRVEKREIGIGSRSRAQDGGGGDEVSGAGERVLKHRMNAVVRERRR